ncbi:MAG: nucleotidyltransferase family protein, partial [Anaerolineae bacterium]|nr:nucleotidyltransferase family protein [Anaerolineae bacterium]
PLPALAALDTLDSGVVDETLLALSPESLLIGCLRGRWDPAAWDIARSGMPASAPEWELWARSAVRAGVAPLLATVLRYHPEVPVAVIAAWRRYYVWHLRRNSGSLRELARLLRALHDAGISTLLLKGAALGVAVYGNVGLRPMGDIDLLVQREDAARALALLETLDYAVVGAETRPGATLEYENEVALMHTRKPELAVVELHWGLLDSPHYQRTLDMDWFWRTAQPLAFEGASTLMLGPEAQLLHLCAHLMLHHGGASGHLQWYHDIAEVLVAYRDALDWEALLASAAANDLVLPLQRVLPVVWDCWQLEPPVGVRAALAALQASAKEAQLFGQLTVPARPVAQRFFTDLASMPGWRQRWAYAWENIFPAPAYMRDRYRVAHPLLLPFAYLWRWVRGLASILGRRG